VLDIQKNRGSASSLENMSQRKEHPMVVITATNATNTQASFCHLRFGPIINRSSFAAIRKAVSTTQAKLQSPPAQTPISRANLKFAA
jgi:hypothetical protein